MNSPIQDGVKLHVVSFSDSGIQAAKQLADCWLLQPGFSAYGNCHFTALSSIHTEQQATAIAQQSDMIFVLGDGNPASKTQALQWLVQACKTQEVLCYAIIHRANPDFADNHTADIWNQANNVLQIRTTPADSHQTVSALMTEAVMGIATCLLANSLVAVDFDDIKTMMKYDRNIEISSAEASGSQRAAQAAQKALRQLPDINNARAIIANIDIGDIDLAEYQMAANAIEHAASEQCATLTCTSHNPSSNAFKLRITAIF